MAKQLVIGADDFVGRWVSEKSGANYIPGACKTLGFAENGTLIAGIIYEAWNGANISVHIAGVGKRWLDRNFLFAGFDYPFNQLGVKRITGVTPSLNASALSFNEHLGFVREALLKDAYPGQDLVVFRMYRHECRWLNLKRFSNVNGKQVSERNGLDALPLLAGRQSDHSSSGLHEHDAASGRCSERCDEHAAHPPGGAGHACE